MRIVRTRRGARVMHGSHILSEVLALPGPTHSVFDVLAAAVAILRPHGRLAMLGFAAGGMVAPLRACGCQAAVEAVDLSGEGEALFRELSNGWAGQVTLTVEDAVHFLRRGRTRYDAIVEDLSQQIPGDVTKPAVSLEVLPELIRARLAPRGIVVINALPVPGQSMAHTIRELSRAYEEVRVVTLDGWANAVIIAGERVPGARLLGHTLRGALALLGSRLATGIAVRALR